MKLTLKQQRFIQFYSGNATEAALQAGYSKKTAYAIGAENLKKPQITEAIQKRSIKQEFKKIMSREDRQEFWSTIANDVTIDINARLRASELLGKSNADFTENINHSGVIDIQGIVKKFDLETLVGMKNRLLEIENVPAHH